MTQYVTATSFASYTPTASSAQTAWPVTNVSSITRPHRVFKTSAAAGTAQAIVLDFGATQTVKALMLDRCNVSAVSIQGNATNSWSSPAYWATATISQDTLDGRYKLFHDLTAASFSYRYCRIHPNGTATLYGGTVWELGSIAVMGTVSIWGTNMGFPYGRQHMQAFDPGVKIGGGGEPSTLGNPYARIVLSTGAMSGTMMATIDEVMRAGQGAPIVFYTGGTSTAEAYIAHRVGDVRVDVAGPGHLEVAGFTLEEFV